MYNGPLNAGEKADAATGNAVNVTPSAVDAALFVTTGGEGKAVEEVGFATEKLLQSHFEKHAAEWGFNTAEEYLGAARSFFGSKETASVARGADRLFYRESTNEFGVIGGKGNIRTFFKPTQGKAYWQRVSQGLQ